MVTELVDRKLLFLVMTSCSNIMPLWPTLLFIENKSNQWKSADAFFYVRILISYKAKREVFFSFQAFNFDN